MSAELSDSSRDAAHGTSGPAPDPEGHAAPDTRAEIEHSVLEALRPLLGPKKQKRKDVPDMQISGTIVKPLEERIAEDLAERDPEMGFRDLTARSASRRDDEPGPETFAGIGEDLERRSRRSSALVRLLEQHRQQLRVAETERDTAYQKLAHIVPVVQETAAALREAMDARKIDEDPHRMHRLFMLNGRALDELEKVAVTLFADFLWVKSSWEQYAQTVDEARHLGSGPPA